MNKEEALMEILDDMSAQELITTFEAIGVPWKGMIDSLTTHFHKEIAEILEEANGPEEHDRMNWFDSNKERILETADMLKKLAKGE